MELNDRSHVLVRAESLVKRYGAVEALRGISFEIRKGEVFGLLEGMAREKPRP